MMTSRQWSIRRRVLVLAVLPAAAVTALLAVYFSIVQTRDLDQSLRDRGLAIVRQLAPASEYGVFAGDPEVLRPLAEAVLRETDVRAVTIRTAAGRVLVELGQARRTPPQAPDANAVAALLIEDGNAQWFQAPIYQTELALGGDLVTAQPGGHAPTRTTGRVLGWVTAELQRERTIARQFEVWWSTAAIALVVLTLGVALALRMGREITRPIAQLQQTARTMAEGNLDVRIDTSAGRELQALAGDMGAMARALKASRAQLQDRIAQATAELRETLMVLEQRNTALDRARREAETADRAKSEFLATISHEIRTPLNGILGFLSLLSKTPLAGEQRDFVDKIGISSKALLALLNDILDFSKLEAGRVELTPVEFGLREVLEESAYVSVAEARAKGIALSVQVDPASPPRLCGAADRIAQIVKNLVSNAVKFTEIGSVVVTAAPVARSPTRVSMRVSVRDTGIGIAAADRARVFQPFTQLASGTQRRHGGAGLGLAIAKTLVETMGGTIEVDSTPGVGSCFAFTLPLECVADAAAPAHEPLGAAPADFVGRLRVLLADDNDINREYLMLWLTRIGAVVDAVADGAAAIAACETARYDLVLLDLHMPKVDGFEASRRMRDLMRGERPVPIIAITADATSEARERLQRSAMDDVLIKPVSEADLWRIVRRWCPDRTAEPEAPAIDCDAGLRTASGNRELWRRSLHTLAGRLPGQAAELELALAAADFATIRTVAHAIVGAARYCGAMLLAEHAAQLERAAHRAQADDVRFAFASLRSEIVRAGRWIEEHADRESGP